MEYTDRDHFIPFSREQVIRMIIDNGDLIVDERSKFELFCKLLKSIYHFEFHEDLEDLKTSYRLFNPDMNSNEDERQNLDPLTAENNCINRIEKILIDGNYKEVSGDELDTALNEEGIFPVSAEVEFDSFEFYKIYFQGEKRGKSEIKSWIPFKKKEVEFEYYERIVFFFKVKTDAYFRTRKKISVPGTPEKIYLKYFRNIPKSDLEMIFPNLKPRMKTVHKMKIAIPLITGFVIAMQKFIVGPYLLGMGGNPLQEGVSVGLIVLLAGLAGYVFKTYDGYRKVVQKFMSEITQSLYFKDIGNNQGVLTALVDGAEEEEFKEATMAYYFLLKSDQKLTEPELDNLIEEWLEEKHNVKVDFEVDDALGKLEKLNLLERDDRGVLSVPSLDEALRRMDFIWDNYFDYNRAEAT